MRFLKQAIFLLVIWITLSGQSDPFFVIIGITSSILIAICFRRFNHASNLSSFFVLKFIFVYLPWLALQVVLSSIYVAKKIWSVEIDIEDDQENLVKLKNRQKNDLLSTVFANSITLTPGTATIFLDENIIDVHCLTQDTKSGIFDIEKKLLHQSYNNADTEIGV